MAKVGQPGAARLGNFINYYDFNPADRRINFLPKELLSTLLLTQRKEIIILDIGCNSGVNLTINWIGSVIELNINLLLVIDLLKYLIR